MRQSFVIATVSKSASPKLTVRSADTTSSRASSVAGGWRENSIDSEWGTDDCPWSSCVRRTREFVAGWTPAGATGATANDADSKKLSTQHRAGRGKWLCDGRQQRAACDWKALACHRWKVSSCHRAALGHRASRRRVDAELYREPSMSGRQSDHAFVASRTIRSEYRNRCLRYRCGILAQEARLEDVVAAGCRGHRNAYCGRSNGLRASVAHASERSKCTLHLKPKSVAHSVAHAPEMNQKRCKNSRVCNGVSY